MSKPEPAKPMVALASKPEPPTINPERPCWGVYESWVQNEKGRRLKPGVYRHTTKSATEGDDEDKQPALVDEWIASPVFVEARTLNSDDGSEGRLLRLVTHGGMREWVMPMEVFGGSGEDARRTLFAMGAVISQRKRCAFMEYLLEQEPRQTVATTNRPGWHESRAFVLPGRVIGGEGVRYQSSGRALNLYTVGGSLEAWQSQVAAYCVGNPVLTLAIGCALAGPLLSLVGVNGGGVHLIGDSSSGKSLAQLVGASVWGNPGVFAASWDMSKGGLEIEAAGRNDTLLPLDEIKRANPKQVQEMAYALANGQGKGTMTREREGRAKLSWRLLTLSSGERSLSEHAAIAGNPAHAGAELRMVDVDAGTREYRAFDDLHGMTGEDFHRALTVAAGQNYGHLGTAFVERLTAGDDRAGLLEDFAKVRARFIVDNAQAGRVADRFAVIALAGEMAIAYDLLPWPVGASLADSLALYREWLERVGSGNAEDRQILGSIASFIERHGDSRFSDLDAGDSTGIVRDRAGYWKIDQQRRLYLFNRSGLQEAATGFGLTRIGKALDTAGALAKRDTDAKRYTKKYRLPGGGSVNLYVIDPEHLAGEGAPHE
ncbi:RNA helicase [Pseudomonas sp. 1-7]|nr:RNA helicase [Pseudomonas sp. 1-7]